MGFTEVKARILNCLRSGEYDHEARGKIEVKNLLACGQVTEEDVIRLVSRTNGGQYVVSPHHADQTVMVHVFRPIHHGVTWYIKFYFIEPGAVFISVHL
ncbi:hypothetical protein [Geomesophilobacter sediminis]|uniref:Uncharacterized protein n=1 Tax=Geomesophilobacter sediminis TaxID=2798584 RepID=A0A8J7SA37_9BACT|nr:hypothetical protein [Geomesophilobacter sediminis]MBJ6727176.1 hypothetical protein [Geomesophilobacter sediminis]